MPNIVVIGAGVSGLTSALLLSKSEANNVTIIAKHMPGDYDIEYTSPWAGADFMPMAAEENSRWERRTWPELKRLATDVPEAGIHFQKSRLYRRDKDIAGGDSRKKALYSRNPWYSSLFDDYRELNKDELIAGADSGCEFTSVCISTTFYLHWLLGQCLRNGVVVKRAVLSDISEAKTWSHSGEPADFIINATGLGSFKLGGVQDTTLAPIRGQTVLVRNEYSPMNGISGTDDGPTEGMYVMQRAAGGGTILGGTFDKGNWESVPDPNIAVRIMQRVVEAHPGIAGGKGIAGLSVIRHCVGLRPFREGGVRIEEERLDDTTSIVHNYGHSGWGYQASYGCAEGVVEIVNKLRKEKGESLDGEPQLFAGSSQPV